MHVAMAYPTPLLPATLVRRYKRFLADVLLPDGASLTVHCPNSGSMATCGEFGSAVRLSDSHNAARKLRFTWEQTRVDTTWVGVNTAVPNRAVAHFVRQGRIPELAGYDTLRREVPYGAEGASRIDLLLGSAQRPPCFVEVKNATLRVGRFAAFPDARTTRGQRHVRELTAMRATGARAVIFFFVGRTDCDAVRPADEVDPMFGQLLRAAHAAGVEVLAYRMVYDEAGVELGERLPVVF